MSAREEIDEARLRQIAAGDWDDIGEAEQASRIFARRQAQEDAAEVARVRGIVRGALTTTAGQALLVWLEQQTLKRRPDAAQAGATTAEAYAIAAARREGQCGLVLTLIEILAEPADGQAPRGETQT